MDPPLRRRAPRERELRAGQPLEVAAVLAQDRQRALGVEHLPVARDHVRGPGDQRLEAVERGHVGRARAPGREHRDLDRREVVAGAEDARPGDGDRHPVGGVAGRGVELELGRPDAAAAGDRQRLNLAEPERPAALDVVLVVEVAQRALGRPRLGTQALERRLRDSERRLREGQAPEQVVPVAVRGQQADDPEAGLPGDLGQRLELAREDRRVDAERLAAAADERARRPPRRRRGDEDVLVERDEPQSPRSLSAALRSLTSSVGFLAPGSSCSPRRLTQITGTFCLMHGSTSW